MHGQKNKKDARYVNKERNFVIIRSKAVLTDTINAYGGWDV